MALYFFPSKCFPLVTSCANTVLISLLRLPIRMDEYEFSAAKTELVIATPAKYGPLYENLSVNFDDCSISGSSTLKNLGVSLDSHLTF